MYSHGIFPLITKPTRISSTSSTLIDNIFSNNIIGNSIFKGILFTDVSDHFPVFSINLNENIKVPTYYQTRSYSKEQVDNFINRLKSVDWNEVVTNENGKHAFEIFYDKFSALYNEDFPVKTYKTKYSNRKVWLTGGLKQCIKIKNKLYLKAKRTKAESIFKEYKHYRSKLNKLLRITERAYYEEVLSANKGNLKKFWKILKGVINKSKESHVSDTFRNGAGLLTDKKEIANSFNKFFSNIGKELDGRISRSNTDPLQYININNQHTMFLADVTPLELKRIIINQKESSVGWDGIHAKVVKQTYQLFLTPLLHVMNLSITQGFFPNALKIARVTPIFKSGDSMIFSNYRPVSVLPLFAKILEKLMYNRMIDFINKQKLLYKFQFGFRQQHSTNMALIILVDKIAQAIDNGEIVVGCFLDFKKAFDTVNHSILLDKLYKYGIRGIAHDWISDYLRDREQFVHFKGINSDRKYISCGVPQGSIMGPLLFLIYINDIANVSKILLPILFADDTNVFLSGKSVDETIQKMNDELINIVEWLRSNRLSLNIEKTNFMVFHTIRRNVDMSDIGLFIDRKRIEKVDNVKFIGVILDSNLTWSKHIQMVKTKIARGIGIINKARKSIGLSTLVMLYNTLIYPHFLYCIEVWGSAADVYLSSLFKLQKRCVRLMKSVHYRTHSLPIFKELDILPLDKIHQHCVITFMFKFVKDMLPVVFKEIFHRSDSFYETRQSNKFKVQKCRTTLFQNTMRFKAVREWNSIANIIENNCSFHTYRKKLKKHLMYEI